LETIKSVFLSFSRAVITHGGAGSDSMYSDGTQSAAKIGMDLIKNKKTTLDAVISAVSFLENDVRFNAGTGSQIRADGKTIQMDAACMTSEGLFGAVACIEDVLNPIEAALKVLHSSNLIVSGYGAKLFYENQKTDFNQKLKKRLAAPATSSCDTVGAVAYDGETFSAALSSGGLAGADLGRIGDVPLPGCGLYCGAVGAVACTGDGEFIAHKMLAKEVYSWIEKDQISPKAASLKALTLFGKSVDLGLIILTKNDFAAASRNDMAWSYTTEVE